MSIESWLFLFSAMGAVGGIAQVASLYIQVRQGKNMNPGEPDKRRTVLLNGVWVSRRGAMFTVGMLVMSLVFGVIGFYLSMRGGPLTTVDNVEQRVVQWSDSFNSARQKVPENEQVYFSYIISPASNSSMKVVVSRLKAAPYNNYLTFNTVIVFGPEVQGKQFAIPRPEMAQVVRTAAIEMARSRMINDLHYPLSTTTLSKNIPIGPALTESSFIDALNEIASAEIDLVETVELEMNKISVPERTIAPSKK
jgi:hypothetical protein